MKINSEHWLINSEQQVAETQKRCVKVDDRLQFPFQLSRCRMCAELKQPRH